MTELTPPITYTCPDIDKVESTIKMCEHKVDGILESASIDDTTYTLLAQVSSELSSLYGSESILDELREANRKLREWGNDLSQKHYELLQNYHKLLEEKQKDD